MKFEQFVEANKELMPKIKHEFSIENPAMRVLVRAWNSIAIMFPEKCDDIVTWPLASEAPIIEPNPYRRKKGNNGKSSEENNAQ